MPGRLLVLMLVLALGSTFYLFFWLPSTRAAEERLSAQQGGFLVRVRVLDEHQQGVDGARVWWRPATLESVGGMEGFSLADGRCTLAVPALGRYRLVAEANGRRAERVIRYKIGSQRVEWQLVLVGDRP